MKRRALVAAWAAALAALLALAAWIELGGADEEPAGAVLRIRIPERPALAASEEPAVEPAAPAAERPAEPPTSSRAEGPRPRWQMFARPFAAPEGRPRVAIVINQLGLGRAVTQRAVAELPADVTLAFAPYADEVDQWLEKARAEGHEVMLSLPMEPDGFPADDPGPKALLTSLRPEENLERLDWVLDRAAGYVGVISHMGSRFTTSEEQLRLVLETVRQRGLLFVDARAATRSIAGAISAELPLPAAANDRFIDSEPAPAAIDQRLAELEDIARRRGSALGVGSPYPVTIERVAAWAKGLGERGIALAPVSAVVEPGARR